MRERLKLKEMAENMEEGTHQQAESQERPASKSDTAVDQLLVNLQRCSDALGLVRAAEARLVEARAVSKSRTALLWLERLLLDTAASERVAAGVHYHVCFADGFPGQKLTRYFETGCLAGVMAKLNGPLCRYGLESLPYRVFTASDVREREQQLIDRGHHIHLIRTAGRANAPPRRVRPLKRYRELLRQTRQKWEEFVEVLLDCNITVHSAVLAVIKYSPSRGDREGEEFYLESIGHDRNELSALLTDHSVAGGLAPDKASSLAPDEASSLAPDESSALVPDEASALDPDAASVLHPLCPTPSLSQQLGWVCRVSNLHFDSSPTNPTLQRNLCVSLARNRTPISVRNQLIFFQHSQNSVRLRAVAASLVATLRGEEPEGVGRKWSKSRMREESENGELAATIQTDKQAGLKCGKLPKLQTQELTWVNQPNGKRHKAKDLEGMCVITLHSEVSSSHKAGLKGGNLPKLQTLQLKLAKSPNGKRRGKVKNLLECEGEEWECVTTLNSQVCTAEGVRLKWGKRRKVRTPELHECAWEEGQEEDEVLGLAMSRVTSVKREGEEAGLALAKVPKLTTQDFPECGGDERQREEESIYVFVQG